MTSRRGAHELRSVVEAFGLSGAALRCEPIGSGHINETYRVADDGAGSRVLILQRINAHVFRNPQQVMDNIERVLAHLHAGAAGSAPRVARDLLTLVQTQSGALRHVDPGGGLWRAYECVPQTFTRTRVESVRDAALVGAAFGEFQVRLSDLPAPRLHETIPDFHNTPLRLAAFRAALAADVHARAVQTRSDCAALLAQAPLAEALEAPRQARAIPERVVHNDAKLSNVLLDVRSGAARCVIDLDTVMPGLALHDFGDMVRSCTCRAAEDDTNLATVIAERELFAALAEGYLTTAGRMLTAEERRLLVTAGMVITYEQALRFMTDYLEGDRYYRTSRPGQNLDRARNQLSLLHSLAAQRDTFESIVARA